MKEINNKEAISLTNRIYDEICKNVKKYDSLIEGDISYSEALRINSDYSESVMQSLALDMKKLRDINKTRFNMIIFGKEEVDEQEFYPFIYNTLSFVAAGIKRDKGVNK